MVRGKLGESDADVLTVTVADHSLRDERCVELSDLCLSIHIRVRLDLLTGWLDSPTVTLSSSGVFLRAQGRFVANVRQRCILIQLVLGDGARVVHIWSRSGVTIMIRLEQASLLQFCVSLYSARNLSDYLVHLLS